MEERFDGQGGASRPAGAPPMPDMPPVPGPAPESDGMKPTGPLTPPVQEAEVSPLTPPNEAFAPTSPAPPTPPADPEEPRPVEADPEEPVREAESPDSTLRAPAPIPAAPHGSASPNPAASASATPAPEVPPTFETPGKRGPSIGVILGIAAVVLVAAVGIGLLTLGGGTHGDGADTAPPAAEDAPAEDNEPGQPEAGDEAKEDEGDAEGDGVIHAETVDVSSKYSFEVVSAAAGVDVTTEEPVCILIGTFRNDSDEPASFSGAISAEASQNGVELGSAYLYGSDATKYDDVAPGESVQILMGWDLVDAEAPVDIVVRDERHYTRQVIFEQQYSVDELIANYDAFVGVLDGIAEDGENVMT